MEIVAVGVILLVLGAAALLAWGPRDDPTELERWARAAQQRIDRAHHWGDRRDD